MNHDILLRKLHHYSIRGFVHDWIRSYLENRTQYVQINNISSGKCINTHGVPQGPILGPLLFLIQINDLPNASDIFKFNLFADDSTISYTFDPSDLVGARVVVNGELNHVYRWLCSNKVKINIYETKYIVFSYRNRIIFAQVKFGGGIILQTDNCKFLGLHLDEALKFDKHIIYISCKISKSIGILNRVKFTFPSEIMLPLYFSIIHPYIMYAIEFWYAAPSYLSNRILVLQKKSVRIVYNLPYNDHTRNYFALSGLLTLPYLYKRSILLYMFKTLKFGYDSFC